MNPCLALRLRSMLALTARTSILAVLLLAAPALCKTSPPASHPQRDADSQFLFLFHDDPAFIEGLRRHDLLRDYGLRLHNTGLVRGRFGDRWADRDLLRQAQSSGRRYYIDRISGGMPFQSLEGIEVVARRLKDDPQFIGFQFHEWVNAPLHDHKRIQELLIDKGLPFDRRHLSDYEGRIESPFLGGGDFAIYDGVFRPLKNQDDAEQYLRDYFRRMSALTHGQLMAVNGYYQFYHAALDLGAKNVMAEIGNQVPLTALQIACVRGAARQFGKPFGVYYEPWGGSPFGCPCALGWSPWFPGGGNPDQKVMGYRIRPELGSSRSLHRRLLYYAWLSGASWWAEEWGAENYFSNWQDYPLTDYGRVTMEFLDVTRRYARPDPVVPAAIILPPKAAGIDLRYTGRYTDLIYERFPPDELHVRMRHFADKVLAARPRHPGSDDYNLTPSPWIGSFDVLSADAPDGLLDRYGLLVCLDDRQLLRPVRSDQTVLTYHGNDADASSCVETLQRLRPFQIEGQVGSALARLERTGFVLGVFNNTGIARRSGQETADPQAACKALVRGPLAKTTCLTGSRFISRQDAGSVELLIPAGELVILLVPDNARPRAGG